MNLKARKDKKKNNPPLNGGCCASGPRRELQIRRGSTRRGPPGCTWVSDQSPFSTAGPFQVPRNSSRGASPAGLKVRRAALARAEAAAERIHEKMKEVGGEQESPDGSQIPAAHGQKRTGGPRVLSRTPSSPRATWTRDPRLCGGINEASWWRINPSVRPSRESLQVLIRP